MSAKSGRVRRRTPGDGSVLMTAWLACDDLKPHHRLQWVDLGTESPKTDMTEVLAELKGEVYRIIMHPGLARELLGPDSDTLRHGVIDAQVDPNCPRRRVYFWSRDHA